MKIQYLGTAAAEGWPGLFCNCAVCREATRRGGRDLRTRSQALIDDGLLVDFPPDSYLHMLQYHVPLPHIHTILLTHAHQDHFYPLDLTLRGKGFSDEIDGVLTIYGAAAGREMFERTCAAISPDWELDRRLRYVEIQPFVPFTVEGYRVTPVTARHDPSQLCLNFIIERGGKKLLYANDTGMYLPQTMEFLARSGRLDLISLDCTMGRQTVEGGHMGLEQNRILMRKLRELGCADAQTTTVITHFSHHGGLLHSELEQAVAQDGWLVAYDGRTVEV